MAEKDIGAIVVVEGKKLVGMLSERDYARRVILIGKTSREMVVQEVMSSPVCTVTPDHTISECLALMTNRRIRHLPVLEGTALCGVISIGDLVKEIVSRQISLIKGYENYIRGVYPI
jgi:CBS domain-containing protein